MEIKIHPTQTTKVTFMKNKYFNFKNLKFRTYFLCLRFNNFQSQNWCNVLKNRTNNKPWPNLKFRFRNEHGKWFQVDFVTWYFP